MFNLKIKLSNYELIKLSIFMKTYSIHEQIMEADFNLRINNF